MVRLTLHLQPVPFLLDSLVTSAPALRINTTNTELGTRLSVDEISLLPTTADVRQLIHLTPGARPNQIWGGASDQANSYLLDGTLVNHIGLGGVFFLPSPTWIESLDVRGLGAGAELGNFQGGLVEVVTLNGGNRMEGGIRASFESHRFNGSNLIPGEIGRELSSRQEVDGQIRGPLIRDRLHFALFGHLIRGEERVLNRLPGGVGEFTPTPPAFDDFRWLGKMSWKGGARDLLLASLMGRFQRGDRTGQSGYEAAEATERLRHWNLTGNVTWKRGWTKRSALELRLGGYAARERREPYAGQEVPGVELFSTGNPPRYSNAPFRSLAEPSSLGASAMWTLRGRLAGLEHDMKLGGEGALGFWEYHRARNGGMTWRPWPSSGFDPGNAATWPGAPFPWMKEKTIGTIWGGEVRVDSRVVNGAVFLQDHIRLAPWLRFNPGIRFGWWSGALTPVAGPRFTAVSDNAFEPRLGLVVDLDRRGGLVAKAHFGRYHQSMFAALFDRVEGGGVFQDEEHWSYLGPAPASAATAFSGEERDALAAAGVFRLDERVQLSQVGRVENYRQPYVDQTVLSLEKTFGGRWKTGVTYVFRKNHNQTALVDRHLASNYTIIENVVVRDRLPVPIYLEGAPLVMERLALSNQDIIRVWQMVKQFLLPPFSDTQVILPPGLSFAQLDALRYDPDFVLTTVPEATRRFEQLQVQVDARYRTWWAGASATFTSLRGNFNAVSGPDDYSTGGPGPWVRLNEQYNFYGDLSNQSQIEAKLHFGGLLPGRFRGGVFLSLATGDRVTPTMTISTLVTEYGLTRSNRDHPGLSETVPLHPLLLESLIGSRMFLRSRGTYRYETWGSLDLHLERGFSGRGTEVVVALDAFNLLGDQSVTATETAVNSTVGVFERDYGRVRGRVPPRTFRLGAAVRF